MKVISYSSQTEDQLEPHVLGQGTEQPPWGGREQRERERRLWSSLPSRGHCLGFFSLPLPLPWGGFGFLLSRSLPLCLPSPQRGEVGGCMFDRQGLNFTISYYLYSWVTWCKLPLQIHFPSSKEAKIHRGRIYTLPVCSRKCKSIGAVLSA